MYPNVNYARLRSANGIAVAENQAVPKAGPVDVPHSRKPFGPGRPFDEPPMRGAGVRVLSPGGTVLLKDASYVTSSSLSAVLPSREQMVAPPPPRPGSLSVSSLRHSQSGAATSSPDPRRLMQRPVGSSMAAPCGKPASLGASRQAALSYQSGPHSHTQGSVNAGKDAMQAPPSSGSDAGACTSIEAPPGGFASGQLSGSQKGMIPAQMPANQPAEVPRSVQVPSNPLPAQAPAAYSPAAGGCMPSPPASSRQVLGPWAAPFAHGNRHVSPVQHRGPIQHQWRPGAVRNSSPPPSSRSLRPEPAASCAFQAAPPSAAFPGRTTPGFGACNGTTMPTGQTPPGPPGTLGLMRRISQAASGLDVVRQTSSSSSCQAPPGSASAAAGRAQPHVVRQSSSCSSPPAHPGTPILSHRQVAVVPRSPLQMSRSVRTLAAEPLSASQQSGPPLAQIRTVRRSVSATPRLTRGVSAPVVRIATQPVAFADPTSIASQPAAFAEPTTSALPTHRGSNPSGDALSHQRDEDHGDSSIVAEQQQPHDALPEWMEQHTEQQLQHQDVLLQTGPAGLTVPEEEEGLRPDWAYLYCEADRERCEMKQKLAEEVREKRDLEFRIALVKKQLEEKTAQVAELMGDGSASLSPSEETKNGHSFTQS